MTKSKIGIIHYGKTKYVVREKSASKLPILNAALALIYLSGGDVHKMKSKMIPEPTIALALRWADKIDDDEESNDSNECSIESDCSIQKSTLKFSGVNCLHSTESNVSRNVSRAKSRVSSTKSIVSSTKSIVSSAESIASSSTKNIVYSTNNTNCTNSTNSIIEHLHAVMTQKLINIILTQQCINTILMQQYVGFANCRSF